MKDKVALITGASSGIGRATAELFSAKTIAFLCSEEASYITGTTITPDGRFSLTL